MYKRGNGINVNISSNLRQGWGSVLQVDLAEQPSLTGPVLVVRGHSDGEYSRGSSGASRG